MVFEKIKADLITAIKARDQKKIAMLRFLISEIKNYEISAYPPGATGSLTDNEVISVLFKQSKNRKESIEMFEKGKRGDLAAKEKEELEVINSYLPERISGEEIKKMVVK